MTSNKLTSLSLILRQRLFSKYQTLNSLNSEVEKKKKERKKMRNANKQVKGKYQ